MRLCCRWSTILALSVALIAPIATVGCAEHHYRAYDPYYNDYHRWDNHEEVYYRQWASENHKNRDYRHLDRDDQQRYWQWRHNHGDHDHDRDHDRDRDHDHDRH